MLDIVLGLHLATWHSSQTYEQTHPVTRHGVPTGESIVLRHPYENRNVGLYVRAGDWVVGGYRNSFHRDTGYAARVFETENRRWAITVGAATGYPTARVMPLVVPSVRIPLGDLAARVSVIPKPPKHAGTMAVHLSIEKEL